VAVNFVSASTQSLQNAAPPAFAYPFTVAMWTVPTGLLASRTYWCWTDNTTTNNYFELSTTAGGSSQFQAQAGGSLATMNTTGSSSPLFIIARAISATDKRLAAFGFNNAIVAQTNSATNATPTGLNTMVLGARVTSAGTSRSWDGRISEFWWTNSDIGLGQGALDAPLIQKLAREGPFSVPHVANNVVEYRSFRDGIQAPGGGSRETYFGNFGSQVWSAVNAPTLLPAGVAISSLYPRRPSRNNLRSFMPDVFFGGAIKRRRRLIVLG